MQNRRPIAYMSKALSGRNRALSIYGREFFGCGDGNSEMEKLPTRPQVHYQD